VYRYYENSTGCVNRLRCESDHSIGVSNQLELATRATVQTTGPRQTKIYRVVSVAAEE
jgi:hypothetical protein